MTTIKQIEANRLNALKSTGPRTEEGKRRSRCNAIRHGLTAETVIADLEDPEDYETFEATIVADYDPTTAVERELVLRLACALWRLRRATGIETALFQSVVNQPVQLESEVTSGAAMDLMRSRFAAQQKRDPDSGRFFAFRRNAIRPGSPIEPV